MVNQSNSSQTMLTRKYVRICAAVAIPLLLYMLFLHSSHISSQYQTSKQRFIPPLAPELLPSGTCELNLTTLDPYDLTPTIQYTRRYIYTHSTSERLDHVVDVEDTLVPGPQSLDRKSNEYEDGLMVLLNCNKQPLRLAVAPEAPPAEGSTILFGVATSVERLKESLVQMRHWLGDGKASLFALVPNDPKVDEVRAQLKAWGIDGTIKTAEGDFRSRYFDLVSFLQYEISAERARRPHIRWVGLIDDDTFFPSINEIVNHLETYDHTKPQYIGGISEDFYQISKHGLFAFGGAGIFMSLPLLDQVYAYFDECQKSEKDIDQGDVKLVHCIYKHTRTKLTIESNLHQMDFFGDTRGIFESGRRLLSIHHWKTWYHLDVVKLSAVSEVCGEACILQRWKFQSPNVVLTNGYSIIQYKSQVPNLMETEKTWDVNVDLRGHNRTLEDESKDFAHSLAPLRPKLEEGKDKVSHDLVDAVSEAGGRVRQVYIKRGVDGGYDSVIELFWVRDPSPPVV